MEIFKKRTFFQLLTADDHHQNDSDDQICIKLASFSNVINHNTTDNDDDSINQQQKIQSERNLVLYTSDYRLHLFQYGVFVDLQDDNVNDNHENGKKSWRHWIIPLDSKKGEIVSMCLNTNGDQLLAITDKSIIYIIPFQFIIYYDQICKRYRTIIDKDAIVRSNHLNTIQQPTSIVWWQCDNQRLKHKSVAIVGTKCGQISMIDLDNDKEFNHCRIPLPIRSLKLYREMYNRSLLITCSNDEQYYLILEEHHSTTAVNHSSTSDFVSSSAVDNSNRSSTADKISAKKSFTSPFMKLTEYFTNKRTAKQIDSKSMMNKNDTKLKPSNDSNNQISPDFNNYYLSCLLNLPFENDDDVIGQVSSAISTGETNNSFDDGHMETLLQPQSIKFNHNYSTEFMSDDDIFSFNAEDLLVVPLMPSSNANQSFISSNRSTISSLITQQQPQQQPKQMKIAIYPPNNKLNDNTQPNIFVVKYQNCAKIKLTNQTSSASSSSSNRSSSASSKGNEADTSSEDGLNDDDDFLIVNNNNDNNSLKKSSNESNHNQDNTQDFCNISLKNEQIIFELYEYSCQKFCTRTIVLSSARLYQITLTMSDSEAEIQNDHSKQFDLIELIDCSHRFIMLVFTDRIYLISKTFSEQTNRSNNNRFTVSATGAHQTSTPRSPLLLKRSDSSGHRRTNAPANNRLGGSFRRKSPVRSPLLHHGSVNKSASIGNLSSTNETNNDNCSIVFEYKFPNDNEIIDVFNVNQSQTHGMNIRDYVNQKLFHDTDSMMINDQRLDYQERSLIELLSSNDLDKSTIQLDEEFIVVTKYNVYIIETEEKSFGKLFHNEVQTFIDGSQNYQDGDLINCAKFLVDCYGPANRLSNNRTVIDLHSPLKTKTPLNLHHPHHLIIPSQSWQLWLCRTGLLLMKNLHENLMLQNNDEHYYRCLTTEPKTAEDLNCKQYIDKHLNQIFRILELSRCPRRRVITALNMFRFWTRSAWQIEKFFHTRILFELNDDERNYLSLQMFESLLSIYEFYLDYKHHRITDDNQKEDLNRKICESKQNLYHFLHDYRQYYSHRLILYRLIQLNLFELSEYLALLHGDYLHLVYYVLKFKCINNDSIDDNHAQNTENQKQIIRLLTSNQVTYSLILSVEYLQSQLINNDNGSKSLASTNECRSIMLIELYLKFVFKQLTKLSLKQLYRLANVFNVQNLAVRLLLNQTLIYCNQTYLCGDTLQEGGDNQDDDIEQQKQQQTPQDGQNTSSDSINTLSESDTSLIVTSQGNLRRSLLPIKFKDLLNMDIFLQSLFLKKLLSKKSKKSNHRKHCNWTFYRQIVDQFISKHDRLYQQQLHDYYDRKKCQRQQHLEFGDNYFNYHVLAGTHCSMFYNDKHYYLWGQFEHTFTNSERLEQTFCRNDSNDDHGVSTSSSISSNTIKQISKPQCNEFFSTIINDPIRSIAIGYQHMIILCDAGIYGIGSSIFGQLGLGAQILSTRYPMLLRFDGKSISKVACGSYHTLLLSNDGHLYSFGWSLHGQLGHGLMIDDQFVPRLVQYFIDINVSIADVSAGYAHTAALTTTGDLYVFGQNCYGQLGIDDHCDDFKNQKVFIPQKFSTLSSPIRMVCCGPFHTVIVTAIEGQEKLYCWGIDPKTWRIKMRADRAHYQYHIHRHQSDSFNNNSSKSTNYAKIREISLGKLARGSFIKKIAAGQSHTLLLTDQGMIYSFGTGRDGQLGLSLIKQHNDPHQQQVQHAQQSYELEAQQISLKISEDSTDNNNINDDDDEYEQYDYRRRQQNSIHFIDISCGLFHSLAMDIDGNVWGWGQNTFGQLYESNSSNTNDNNNSNDSNSQHHDDLDDSTISLSSLTTHSNDSNVVKLSKHISNMNLSHPFLSNQVQLSTDHGGGGSTISSKNNRWQPSILFSIKNICKQPQTSYDYDNFIGFDQSPPPTKEDEQCSMINRLQMKILKTIIYNRNELNLKSLIRRFEQLELYQLCSLLSYIANDFIDGSSKYLFMALQRELCGKSSKNSNDNPLIIEELINILEFFLQKIESHSKLSTKCRLTAKLLENFINFWLNIDPEKFPIKSDDFVKILAEIYLNVDQMQNAYFGPQLLLIIKNLETTSNERIRESLSLNDQIMIRILRKSNELIEKSLRTDSNDPIVTIQELFDREMLSTFKSLNNEDDQQLKWPLEIQWQSLIDEYLCDDRQPMPSKSPEPSTAIDIELSSSDIEMDDNDPLLLMIFKCGHTMTVKQFEKSLISRSIDDQSYEQISKKLSKSTNDTIDYESINQMIKQLNCIDCFVVKNKNIE